MREARPEDSETSYRSRLAQFGLGFEKQSTTVENLSGGERARLLLNMVAMAAPHLLILDEPTNHLDIDSRRALLDALNDYEGAVILITHDRSLMELVADRLWLAADGTVAPFDGDMDDYARLVLDRARGVAPGQGRAAKGKKKKGRHDTGRTEGLGAQERLDGGGRVHEPDQAVGPEGGDRADGDEGHRRPRRGKEAGWKVGEAQRSQLQGRRPR